jgi:hypothetical protein
VQPHRMQCLLEPSSMKVAKSTVPAALATCHFENHVGDVLLQIQVTKQPKFTPIISVLVQTYLLIA